MRGSFRGDRPLTRPRCQGIASTLSHKGRGEAGTPTYTGYYFPFTILLQ
jgi:hypothetical protein